MCHCLDRKPAALDANAALRGLTTSLYRCRLTGPSSRRPDATFLLSGLGIPSNLLLCLSLSLVSIYTPPTLHSVLKKRVTRQHPFVIFVKARDIQDTVPMTYIQRSYHNVVIHSSWVLRLIWEMETAGMPLIDPFIGYFAAIAATIQLELTIGKNESAAQQAKQRFKQACRFIKGLSQKWPNMLNIVSYYLPKSALWTLEPADLLVPVERTGQALNSHQRSMDDQRC